MLAISISALRSWVFCIIASCSPFIVAAQSAPTNDECSGAIALPVNTDNSCTSTYSGTTGYATQSLPSCLASGYDAKDAWYKFTATATTHRITVTPISYDNYIFQVFSGSCGSLTPLACVNTGGSTEPDVVVLNALTVGNVYYLRIYDYYGGGSTFRTFSVCINAATSLVDNDDCSGALNVVPSTNPGFGTNVTANNTGATQSLPGCYGTAEDDIWFKFTATATRHKIVVNTNNSINPVLQVYSGNCTALSSLACRYTAVSGTYSYVDADMNNLTVGNTYYYRVYGAASNNIRTTISTNIASPPAPPANDECSGAILLPVNNDATCTSTYSGTTGYATQGPASCVASGYDARDVWFKFVATATTHRITLTPVSYDNYVFQVYSGTCSNLTSLACVNTGASTEPDVVVLNNLTAGTTYYMRLWDYFGGGSTYRTFSICINTTASPVDNDDCTGALTVTPSASADPGTNVNANNTGATQSAVGCYGTAEDDIWFKFTTTATRHKIVVNTNNSINPVLEVYSGNCTTLSSLACRYTATSSPYSYIDADLTSLTVGSTYYYRVYGAASNNIRTSISTNISSPPAPPANDECSGAIAVSVGSDASCTNVYNGTIGYATQSLPSCVATGYDAKDVWFKFVATATSHRVLLSNINTDDYVFQVYSGTCGNLTSIACVNNGGLGDPDVTMLTNLAVGSTYYIRLWDYYGNASTFRQFSLCINRATSNVNNDDCSGALTVTPAADASPGTNVSAYTVGATQSLPGCYGYAEDDVWFKFTATATRHKIVVYTNELINPVLQLYSGTCASPTSISCRYSDTASNYDYIDVDLSTFVVGNTYYYRVYGGNRNSTRTSFVTSISTLQGPLPIELVSFTLQPQRNSHRLLWQTHSEANNKGFVVEWSANGRDYDSLAFVASKAPAGNSTQPQDYTYTHNTTTLLVGKVYYRLRQLDKDGAIKYSNIVSASLEGNAITLYPNPVKGQVYFNLLSASEYKYTLLDATGRMVRTGILSGAKLDVADLKPGLHLVALNRNGVTTVLKFLKE